MSSTETAIYVRASDKQLLSDLRSELGHDELGVPKRATVRQVLTNELERLEGSEGE